MAQPTRFETERTKMAQRTDQAANLPALTAVRTRPVRGSVSSVFLSQLIAERHNLSPQREKRRAPVDQAVSAYHQGAQIAVRRLPQGYRKTIVA